MIQVSPNATIYVVENPISFSSRLKGTLAICRDLLSIEPMDGCVTVFRNKAGTNLRIVFYDGDGFWICEKAFSRGRMRDWARSGGVTQVTARELAVLLWRGDVRGAAFPPFWKRVAAGP